MGKPIFHSKQHWVRCFKSEQEHDQGVKQVKKRGQYCEIYRAHVSPSGGVENVSLKPEIGQNNIAGSWV